MGPLPTDVFAARIELLQDMENVMYSSSTDISYDSLGLPMKVWEAFLNGMSASALYWAGLFKYSSDFLNPMVRAYAHFIQQELTKLEKGGDLASTEDYEELLKRNATLAAIAWKVSMDKAWEYHSKEYRSLISSLAHTVGGDSGETVEHYTATLVEALRKLVIDLPRATRDIRGDYGFHFDEAGYVQIAETDRMLLYQVLPTDPGVKVNPGMKPVLTAHPYVLGPNILAFLPGERRSYVHSFANHGIPTYVRIIKEIHANPAVQVMTGEDDTLDTRFFANILVERHGKPVTLNGACQGGFILLADLLSGQLDGLVDALITAASPLDGTKSQALKGYLDGVPAQFRDLASATKTLSNGNRVVDGEVMSLVYKLKSIDKEFPLFAFYRDLDLFEENTRRGVESISKTAAAIGYWLMHDRTDLPLEITELSSISYAVPISPEGNLPFGLFGKRLNLSYIPKNRINFLICYGADDRLVEPASALAPLDFIGAEVTEFPKGHAAIFTSWSHPESEYALDKKFANGQRGPVRFHLDLDEGLPVEGHKRAA